MTGPHYHDSTVLMLLAIIFILLLLTCRLGLARVYQEKGFAVIWIINPEKMGMPPTSEVSATTETSQ